MSLSVEQFYIIVIVCMYPVDVEIGGIVCEEWIHLLYNNLS